MAYNRKMRKFEGTCYIPGEQLAMMAKYYRGANLNLNLTLYEDDLATMQETLDQACWCSKLDEVDRMKMAHMKGNEWRIAHDHCLVGDQHGHDGRNPKVYPALPQKSRSTVDKVERGTSTISLYDRERGLVRGGRYQRNNYSEKRSCMDYYYDRRNHREDNYNLQTRTDDVYDRRHGQNEYNDPRDDHSESYYHRLDYHGRQNRWGEYNESCLRKGYYSDPLNLKKDNEMHYRREDYPGQPRYHAQMVQKQKRVSGKHEMESDAASSLPEVPEIRCAVCNLETCWICKNHLYSPLCQCKCPTANAGLCNRCSQEPCEGNEEQVAQETRGNKMDVSSMMLTMMMNSMFKQSQVPESVCCCKPGRDDSETTSSEPSCEKVHTVYLYDCQGPLKEMACDCCKCSKKPKKNSVHKDKFKTDSNSEGPSENDPPGQKHRSLKAKGRENSKRRSKKGGDSDSDSHKKPKRNESSGKSTEEKEKGLGQQETSKKSRQGGDPRSTNSSKDEKLDKKDVSMRVDTGITRGSKAQGDIDTTSNQLPSTEQCSLSKSQGLRTSISDHPKVTWSYEKSPQKTFSRAGGQFSVKDDTQRNITNLESPKKGGSTGGFGDESSTAISLREFIVCLPIIQSNLQSLMNKLNQMDVLNDGLQYSQINPSLASTQLFTGNMQTRHEIPLLCPSQKPMHDAPGSSYKQNLQQYNNEQQKPVSATSIGDSPKNLPVQNLPPIISPGSSKDESKIPSSSPNVNHSVVNFSNLGGSIEPNRSNLCQKKQILQFDELAESFNDNQSTFNSLPLVGGYKAKNVIEHPSENQWSYKNGCHPAHSPSTCFPLTDQDLVKHHSVSRHIGKLHCPAELGQIRCYQPGSNVKESGFEPPSSAFRPISSLSVEVPESAVCYQGNNTPRKSTHNFQSFGTAAARVSLNDGETVFQSCNQESSATSNQDLTECLLSIDEKFFKPSPLKSAKQAGNKGPDIPSTSKVHKCIDAQHDEQNHIQCEKRTSRITNYALKVHKGVLFKAKHRSSLSLEKLVQGCNLRRRKVARALKKLNVQVGASIGEPYNMKPQGKGVGPGKFRRSKSKSSLGLLKGNPLEQNEIKSLNRPNTPRALEVINSTWRATPKYAGENCGIIALQNKILTGPIKEEARHTLSTAYHNLSPETKMSPVVNDFPPDQANSISKTSNQHSTQRMGSQSCVVSSVEFKTIDSHGSSTDVLKMVQGISSSSLMNMTYTSSVPTGPVTSEDFCGIPLIPLSSTSPSDDPESGNENQLSATPKELFLDNEISSHTPTFLRESRVQVEQLKLAHETIRSMIKNVNEVIAHIDSDSKIGIKSKLRSEDKERLSYFVHFGDDEKKRQSHSDSQNRRNDTNHFEKRTKPEIFSKPSHSGDIENREVQEMFHSVNRVINSVLTASDQSNETQETGSAPEIPAITRAQRDYFVLNSESSANSFTETLRRSLENEESSSIPLATQRPLSQGLGQRPQKSGRPLKRRSWLPSRSNKGQKM